MKQITIQELSKEAEEIKAEKLKENYYDEVEIAYVPVVIGKKDGYVGSISCVSERTITHFEQQQEQEVNIEHRKVWIALFKNETGIWQSSVCRGWVPQGFFGYSKTKDQAFDKLKNFILEHNEPNVKYEFIKLEEV